MPQEHAQRIDDEATLAARIAAGDPALARVAEADFYRCMAPRVRLYGLRHLRDEHAAADLVQQVMMTTIEKLRSGALRETAQVVSFVFGTCRMVVRDQRRGRLRREALLQQFADDVPIVDPTVAPRLDLDRVAHCLDGLAERERTVLLLTFHEEKPADEVAQSLGLTAGNVRVIRHRAIRRLRECVIGAEK